MPTAYLGFSTKQADNWELFATLPKPPRNYKDPVKIQEYMNSAVDAMREDAANKVLTGGFENVVVLTAGSKDDPGPKLLTTDWPKRPILDSLNVFDKIICVQIRLFVRLAIVEYLDKAGSLPESPDWTLALRGLPSDFVSWTGGLREPTATLLDPVRLLCGTDESVMTVFRRFSTKFSADIPVTDTSHPSATFTARIAYDLGKMLRL